VTIDNPPINMYDPRMFAAFNQLMDRLDDADELRVVVFDSAHLDHFIAHYDLEDEEVPDVPGWQSSRTGRPLPDARDHRRLRRLRCRDGREIQVGQPCHTRCGTRWWPATQERIGRLIAAGLQKDGEFELALGHNVDLVD
jgi:hypothetical protein